MREVDGRADGRAGMGAGAAVRMVGDGEDNRAALWSTLGEMPSGVGEGQARMERRRDGATKVEEEVEAAVAVHLSVTREMLLRGLMIACEQQRSRTLGIMLLRRRLTTLNAARTPAHPGCLACRSRYLRPSTALFVHWCISVPVLGLEALTPRVRAPCMRRRSAEQRAAACQDASMYTDVARSESLGRPLHCSSSSARCSCSPARPRTTRSASHLAILMRANKPSNKSHAPSVAPPSSPHSWRRRHGDTDQR